MDDQLAPPSKSLEIGTKTTLPLQFESNSSANCQNWVGDWIFESNPNLNRLAPINRLVGKSRVMMRLRAQILRYAETNETVLILGETGTGKELIANVLHDLSPRQNYPFVAVNCAAIPGALAESELFGSTRGAYTGAVQHRDGLLSSADGGTLFLDEFGELAQEVQSKLLRVLELGTYRPVGSIQEKRADIRIIAATNRNLEKSVHKGEFRADLYYRINVLQIIAPPLRIHPSDIPQIAGKIFSELLPDGCKIQLTEAVMAELFSAPWPGNVRQLKNVLRRSIVMSNDGIIRRLETDLCPNEKSVAADQTQSARAEKLINALIRSKGHLEATARELNVSVRTVQRRIKENGLRLEDFRSI